MSATRVVYEQWQSACWGELGIELPVTSMEAGSISFELPDGWPPFELESGEPFRCFTMQYNLEYLKDGYLFD